ncbi:MAG: hypothetical protein KGK16_17295, partial [Bradyrhizobium sp.]|nr:hypothetical protein [Bradyrhizobium sp.]
PPIQFVQSSKLRPAPAADRKRLIELFSRASMRVASGRARTDTTKARRRTAFDQKHDPDTRATVF